MTVTTNMVQHISSSRLRETGHINDMHLFAIINRNVKDETTPINPLLYYLVIVSVM